MLSLPESAWNAINFLLRLGLSALFCLRSSYFYYIVVLVWIYVLNTHIFMYCILYFSAYIYLHFVCHLPYKRRITAYIYLSLFLPMFEWEKRLIFLFCHLELICKAFHFPSDDNDDGFESVECMFSGLLYFNFTTKNNVILVCSVIGTVSKWNAPKQNHLILKKAKTHETL